MRRSKAKSKKNGVGFGRFKKIDNSHKMGTKAAARARKKSSAPRYTKKKKQFNNPVKVDAIDKELFIRKSPDLLMQHEDTGLIKSSARAQKLQRKDEQELSRKCKMALQVENVKPELHTTGALAEDLGGETSNSHSSLDLPGPTHPGKMSHKEKRSGRRVRERDEDSDEDGQELDNEERNIDSESECGSNENPENVSDGSLPPLQGKRQPKQIHSRKAHQVKVGKGRKEEGSKRFSNIRPGESLRDYEDRLFKEKQQILLEQVRTAPKGSEKRRNYLKERSLKKKKKARRGKIDSEDEGEYDDCDPNKRRKFTKTSKPLDVVKFGEQAQRPPQFKSLPKQR